MQNEDEGEGDAVPRFWTPRQMKQPPRVEPTPPQVQQPTTYVHVQVQTPRPAEAPPARQPMVKKRSSFFSLPVFLWLLIYMTLILGIVYVLWPDFVRRIIGG